MSARCHKILSFNTFKSIQVFRRANSRFIRMADKSKTITLTVVRHGQTDANKEKLMQGKVDIF